MNGENVISCGQWPRMAKIKIASYAFVIPKGSKIAGRTVKRIEKKFGVKIDRVYKTATSAIDVVGRLPAPDTILKSGMMVRVLNLTRGKVKKINRYSFPSK